MDLQLEQLLLDLGWVERPVADINLSRVNDEGPGGKFGPVLARTRVGRGSEAADTTSEDTAVSNSSGRMPVPLHFEGGEDG